MSNLSRFINGFFTSDRHQDGVLVFSNSNRFYLTEFNSSDGCVFLTSSKSYLLLDFRYYEMAKKQVSADVEICLVTKGFYDEIESIVKKHSIQNVWFENFEMSVFEFERLQNKIDRVKFSKLDNQLDKYRIVKKEKEIEFIVEAQKITDLAFSHILNFITREKTEKQIALELEFFIRSHGADGIAFETICVSGKNSSLPHGVPKDITVAQNSFITMDFGAKYNGYCADMTRTVVLGRANDEMKKVYSTVLEAQSRALSKIRADVSGVEVDSAARDYIYACGYEGCFGHSTGHSLGIDVHEHGAFSPGYKDTIPENAILSVEPGIYIEDKFGVRIEDIVVVEKNGYRNLTKSDKNLIEL